MKLPCDIIQDLLALYEDGVCSEETKTAVEEHLKECHGCREAVMGTRALPQLGSEVATESADIAIKKSFKRIYARWWISVIAVIAALPIVLLSLNTAKGSGAGFLNIRELYYANAFVHSLEKGDYERAYGYIDPERLKNDWLERGCFSEEELNNIEAEGKKVFLDAAEALDEAGGITESRYVGIYKELGGYRAVWSVTVGDKTDLLEMDISNSGIRNFYGGGSFVSDPLAKFTLWSELLWQAYEGCRFDPQTGQYVYY
ncbi:MAG: zf-HC2 domain-containing protein [Clostridia bacterium]|nr:zf-HC2 domain-containing protein [Clostridia bacterium]